MKLFYIPAMDWLRDYQRGDFAQDLSAAIVVTVLLIPQSLAYAMLAGVPPEVGLYSSILPLIAYAIFGTSRTLSVGPVAIASLMTASSLGSMGFESMSDCIGGAIVLALLSGVFLMLMGFCKLGFVTQFLSHPVISGFITASGIIIALSQFKHLLGLNVHGDTLIELAPGLIHQIENSHGLTFLIGLAMIIFLIFSKRYLSKILQNFGLSPYLSSLLAKAAPILGVALSIATAYIFQLEDKGTALTGNIPAGLPEIQFLWPPLALIKELALPAFMISIIGYVESISVGRTLAGKRRQKVDADQELVGLGTASIASAFSGGIPVTGGFSRSIVNFEAGAVTQASSIMAAIGIAIASLFLTPILYFLPKATLAATIVIAVISLLDFDILKKTWRYSKSDFWAISATVVVTLLAGVEPGVACGVGLSIALHLYRTSRPHIAEVGLIEGTEHFRNVNRYKVLTDPTIASLRLDESLFFANAGYLEQTIEDIVRIRRSVRHIILQCNAVNEIDYSALEMLEELNEKLREKCVDLHLSEVKGPVMDRLVSTNFSEKMTGTIFMSQYEAFMNLTTLSQQEKTL